MTPFSQFLQQQTPGAGMGRMPFTGTQQYGHNPMLTLQNLFRMMGMYKSDMTQQIPGRQAPTQSMFGSITPQHVEAARQKWIQQSNPASASTGPRY